MRKASSEWHVYRTRFLVRARQLRESLVFVDALGREHRGEKGDYLVESPEGARRITPKHVFEDIYVAMGSAEDGMWPPQMRKPLADVTRKRPPAPRALLA